MRLSHTHLPTSPRPMLGYTARISRPSGRASIRSPLPVFLSPRSTPETAPECQKKARVKYLTNRRRGRIIPRRDDENNATSAGNFRQFRLTGFAHVLRRVCAGSRMCACAHAGARALKNGESILPELYGVRCGEKGTNRAVRRPAPDAGRMSGRHLRLCILPLVAFWGGDWYRS